MRFAARGGCLCAGPYGISLLGIHSADVARLESALLDKLELLRPGFTRVSLPYFATAAEVDFVLHAIRAVADHGCARASRPPRPCHLLAAWASA